MNKEFDMNGYLFVALVFKPNPSDLIRTFKWIIILSVRVCNYQRRGTIQDLPF